MRIERFTARDTKTAMAQIRAAMGADAMILANRRMGDQVEVTAAVHIEEWVEQQEQQPARQVAQLQVQTPATDAQAPVNEIQLKALERELQQLRGMLETELGERQWRDTSGQKPTLGALRQRLLRLGLSRALTGELMQGLEREPAAARLDTAWALALHNLVSRIEQAAGHDGSTLPTTPQIIALFGTTGVGKTSTIAKLAGRDVQRFGVDKVGLISLDSFRIGAREQLSSFASAIGVPLCTAGDAHSLSLAVSELRGRRIYIDSAGMGQHDHRLLKQLSVVNGLREAVYSLVVLSASAQPAQSRAVASLFARGGIDGAIVTKLDEASNLGGVIDVLVRSRIPLHSLTDGQRIPEDLHAGDAQQLVLRAQQVLDSDKHLFEPSVVAGQTLMQATA